MTDVGEILADYVVEEADPGPPPPKEVETAPQKRTRKKKGEPRLASSTTTPVDEAELSRRRDILASVAMLEGLERYAGEPITATDVRKMKEKDLTCLFRVYEEKSGQELLRDTLAIAAEGIVRGLSFFLSFDDREALKSDLLTNKQLGRFVARHASRISEDYGDVVAVLRLAFDVAKHVAYDSTSLSETQSTPPVAATGPA